MFSISRHARLVALLLVFLHITLLQAVAQVEAPDDPSRLLPLEHKWTVALPGAAVLAPVASAGRIFVALHSSWGIDKVIAEPVGQVIAFSAVDGTELWRVSVEVGTSLNIGKGILFLGSPEGLQGFDASTGRRQWSFSLEAPLSAPLAWNNGWLIAALENGELLALSGQTGDLIWKAELDDQVRVAPTLAGRSIYLSSVGGSVAEFSLVSGEKRWEQRLGGAPQEVLALDNIFVGATDNYLYSLSRRDGSINWRWQTGGDIVGRPVAAEGAIHFAALDNMLWTLNRSNGVQRWRRPLTARPIAGPSYADDLLMQGGTSPVIRFFEPTVGTIYGQATAPAELAFPPLLVQDHFGDGLLLVMTTGGGQLYAVAPATGPPQLGQAAIRTFANNLTGHYPFNLPGLSIFEIESIPFSPCMFQRCPLSAVALSPCLFQDCDTGQIGKPQASVLQNPKIPEMASHLVSPAESSQSVQPKVGLLLRQPPSVGAGDSRATSMEAVGSEWRGRPLEFTVLAAAANEFTAKWLVNRLIAQGRHAHIIPRPEEETSSIYWVRVGDYSSREAATLAGQQAEREHLIDWYVVQSVGRVPFAWLW